MIRLEGVSKAYGSDAPALRSVNLDIGKNEFVALVGPSGCGKSTTLHLINRLIEPSSGTICVEGEDIATLPPVALRRRIGFVFQAIGLFPHLTVLENIGMTPRLSNWPPERIARRGEELLYLVRLDPAAYAHRLPAELSGGQQHRVGLARALAAKPKIMLMDEPFGALDPIVRDELAADYRNIHHNLGLTTVMVTHDIVEALLLADRIAVMRAGEIVQVGTPRELVRAPANDFVRTMMDTPRRREVELSRVLGEADEQ